MIPSKPNSPPTKSSSPTPLQGSDFSLVTSVPRRTSCCIFGEGGERKTSFGVVYAPQPVAQINLDGRDKPAVQRAIEMGRKVFRTQAPGMGNVLSMNDVQAKAAGQARVDHVMKNFEWAVREAERGNIRTIQIDTGTELTEAVKLAVLGRVDKVKGDFGASKHLQNQMMRNLYEIAADCSANLIVLARSKEIWLNNTPTGAYKMEGSSVIFDSSDWVGHIRFKRTKKGALTQDLELEIKKSGVRSEELGSVYTAEEWEGLGGPFAYSCLMQYEGSEEEDWK